MLPQYIECLEIRGTPYPPSRYGASCRPCALQRNASPATLRRSPQDPAARAAGKTRVWMRLARSSIFPAPAELDWPRPATPTRTFRSGLHAAAADAAGCWLMIVWFRLYRLRITQLPPIFCRFMTGYPLPLPFPFRRHHDPQAGSPTLVWPSPSLQRRGNSLFVGLAAPLEGAWIGRPPLERGPGKSPSPVNRADGTFARRGTRP